MAVLPEGPDLETDPTTLVASINVSPAETAPKNAEKRLARKDMSPTGSNKNPFSNMIRTG